MGLQSRSEWILDKPALRLAAGGGRPVLGSTARLRVCTNTRATSRRGAQGPGQARSPALLKTRLGIARKLS